MPRPKTKRSLSNSPERGRKRYRGYGGRSTSNTGSRSVSTEERKHSSQYRSRGNARVRRISPGQIEIKKSLPPGFICLYEEDNKACPAYIKKTETNAPIIQVVEARSKPEQFPSPVFDDEQAKRLECLTACVEEMLGGLKLRDERSSDWSESTRNLDEREEKSQAIESNYGFPSCLLFTSRLIAIYAAFTGGFHNSDARTALHHMFIFCRQLLGKDVVKGAQNIGGAAYYIGNSNTIPIYCELQHFSGESLDKAVKETLSDMTERDAHCWVPNCVMYNGESKKEFYLFGECKTGAYVKSELLKQVWHQSLRGLLEIQCVHGCGIGSKYVILVKLNNTGSILQTSTVDIDFRDFKDNETYFDTGNFMQFLKLMTKIVQDYSTSP